MFNRIRFDWIESERSIRSLISLSQTFLGIRCVDPVTHEPNHCMFCVRMEILPAYRVACKMITISKSFNIENNKQNWNGRASIADHASSINDLNSLCRHQQEEDLRENHPFFDTPLFAIARESNFRKFCQLVVEARYDANAKDRLGNEPKISRYKQGQSVSCHWWGHFLLICLFSKFLGLVTYLDWIMIIVTIVSIVSMSFETPVNRVVDQPLLQVNQSFPSESLRPVITGDFCSDCWIHFRYLYECWINIENLCTWLILHSESVNSRHRWSRRCSCILR